MKEPYRFIKRKTKKNIYVVFEHLPGKEFSSGTEDMRQAVVFAETMLRKDWQQFDNSRNRITFGEYAKDFYTEADPHGFRKRKEAKNKKYDDGFYKSHQGRLDNYLMPRFGNQLLLSMNSNAIDEWFVSLRKSNGKQLSSNTKNKILYCLRYIMQTAVTEGYISSDPTKDIESITENDTKNRDAFTLEELYVLFPKDNAELVKAWGGLMWTTYFLVMRDTGWRPAEVSGLKKGDYHPELKGLYTESSVVGGVEKQSIKTTNKGKSYKVGILTDRTISFLEQLIAYIPGDYLFITTEGNFVQPNAANKHLRSVAAYFGINLHGRTQYSFRHSFETYMVGNVKSETLLELMAHTGFRPEYDHRTPSMILKQLSPVHDMLENVFESTENQSFPQAEKKA